MPRPQTHPRSLLPRSPAALLAGFFLSLAQLAAATGNTDDPAALRTRFPPGSIQSREQAETALAAAAAERKRADADYKSRQRACYKKFQVNACLDDEHASHQKVADQITALELEANRFQRSAKSREIEGRRRSADEERARQAEAVAATEAKNRKAYLEKQADAEQQQAHRELEQANRKAVAAKQANKASDTKRRIDDPEMRHLNAQKQSDKERDAAERRARMAKERERKVADRAKREQARMAKQQAQSAGSSAPR